MALVVLKWQMVDTGGVLTRVTLMLQYSGETVAHRQQEPERNSTPCSHSSVSDQSKGLGIFKDSEAWIWVCVPAVMKMSFVHYLTALVKLSDLDT